MIFRRLNSQNGNNDGKVNFQPEVADPLWKQLKIKSQ